MKKAAKKEAGKKVLWTAAKRKAQSEKLRAIWKDRLRRKTEEMQAEMASEGGYTLPPAHVPKLKDIRVNSEFVPSVTGAIAIQLQDCEFCLTVRNSEPVLELWMALGGKLLPVKIDGLIGRSVLRDLEMMIENDGKGGF